METALKWIVAFILAALLLLTAPRIWEQATADDFYPHSGFGPDCYEWPYPVVDYSAKY